MSVVLKGERVLEGEAYGTLVVSLRPFAFAHGVNPENGEVTDIRSDIRGENLKGKILAYRYGKGSTTASAWFLETSRNKNNPSGIIIGSIDNGTIVGALLSRLLYGTKIPVLICRDERLYNENMKLRKAKLEKDGSIRIE